MYLAYIKVGGAGWPRLYIQIGPAALIDGGTAASRFASGSRGVQGSTALCLNFSLPSCEANEQACEKNDKKAEVGHDLSIDEEAIERNSRKFAPSVVACGRLAGRQRGILGRLLPMQGGFWCRRSRKRTGFVAACQHRICETHRLWSANQSPVDRYQSNRRHLGVTTGYSDGKTGWPSNWVAVDQPDDIPNNWGNREGSACQDWRGQGDKQQRDTRSSRTHIPTSPRWRQSSATA